MSNNEATTDDCSREFRGNLASITSRLVKLVDKLSVPEAEGKMTALSQPLQSTALEICRKQLVQLQPPSRNNYSFTTPTEDSSCNPNDPRPMKRRRIKDEEVGCLDDATQEKNTKTPSSSFSLPSSSSSSSSSLVVTTSDNKFPVANNGNRIQSPIIQVIAGNDETIADGVVVVEQVQAQLPPPPLGARGKVAKLAPASAASAKESPVAEGVVEQVQAPPRPQVVEQDLPPAIKDRKQWDTEIKSTKEYYFFENQEDPEHREKFGRLSINEKAAWKTVWKLQQDKYVKKQRAKYSKDNKKGMYAFCFSNPN